MFVYENENDANLQNENNIKTKMMMSVTYRNENIYSENGKNIYDEQCQRRTGKHCS